MELGSQSIKENGSFKYDDNNISFSYTVPEYNKYLNVEYHMLKDFKRNGGWSAKSSISFKNLCREIIPLKLKPNLQTQLWIILQHIHLNLKPEATIAVFIYLIFIIVIVYHINKAYKNYYHKQKEKLIEENNLY
jgi:hypothetical protein